MCGICGFKRAQNANIDTDIQAIKTMCDIMAHRGPDGEGCFVDEGIALGHRRLSLVDLPGGSQPMVSYINGFSSEASIRPTQHALAITFNGEIYNYRELAGELSSAGWTFETHSDTEVLLAGYAVWGAEGLLKRLRGMFAFAIWDSRNDSLFCARDPFGIKPFYFASSPDHDIIFASEAKAILQMPGFEKRLNRHALELYLCFQFNPLSETFFKGIYKLPAAHYMIVEKNGNKVLKRYWRATFKNDEVINDGDTANAIDDAIRRSVKRHNIADVEVGAFLSGGVDSSYVATSLSKLNPNLKTFTVGFSEYSDIDKTKNEISCAEELANVIHTEHKSNEVTKQDFFDILDCVQWHMDEPSADPAAIPLYYLNKMASNDVKAIVSGEGADELFGGYRLYCAPLVANRLAKMPNFVLKAASKILSTLNIRGSNFMKRASTKVSDWYYTNANDKVFAKNDLVKVLRFPVSVLSPKDIVSETYAFAESEDLDDVRSMELVDIEHWLVDDILAKTDKMSMANSVECRVPYLDIDVFETASRVPTRMCVSEKETKMALRSAAKKAVPAKWASKQKLGFPVPLCEWLQDDDVYIQIMKYFKSDVASRFFNTRELVKLLEGQKKGEDMTRKIWCVYMFLVWHQAYFPEEWDFNNA